MPYLIYVRKSRADLEAEQRGEGETLARHRAALLELSRKMGLDIGGIYEEVVSGETIAARPQMQRLLSEVESGQWEGVLVMEVERLARGDSIDQGIVAQAFKYSGTKIITPAKTYNPANEFDEEYFEFGLFMSRREYQTIKRRMIAGRIASVKEGKYMGKTDPYGYFRVKLKNAKGYTLEPNPPQAEIVRQMFKWRIEGAGVYVISGRLNLRGERTSAGRDWSSQAVRNVLRNCLYAGYVTWGRKPGIPTVRDGVMKKPRKNVDEYVKVRGLHEALVSEEDFDAVQKLMDDTPSFCVKRNLKLKNPFVHLLYCGKCGHVMLYEAGRNAPEFSGRMVCRWQTCDNVSSKCTEIEDALMKSLRLWLAEYDVDTTQRRETEEAAAARSALIEDEIRSVHAQQEKLDAQLSRASELVEQGIYTPEHFLSRRSEIEKKCVELSRTLKRLSEQQLQIDRERASSQKMAPKIRHVLESYPLATSAEKKNALLHTIIHRIDYLKHAAIRHKGDSTIYLKITRKFE